MNKLIVIIQVLLNKLSAAYKEIFSLRDLCEAYESHIKFIEKMSKLDKEEISNLKRSNKAAEYSIECHVKSIQNDIKEINKLKEENRLLKQKVGCVDLVINNIHTKVNYVGFVTTGFPGEEWDEHQTANNVYRTANGEEYVESFVTGKLRKYDRNIDGLIWTDETWDYADSKVKETGVAWTPNVFNR